jgi:hypothetical protein
MPSGVFWVCRHPVRAPSPYPQRPCLAGEQKAKGARGGFLPELCAHTPWPPKKASVAGRMWMEKSEDWYFSRRAVSTDPRLAAFSSGSNLILDVFPDGLDTLHGHRRLWRPRFCTQYGHTTYKNHGDPMPPPWPRGPIQPDRLALVGVHDRKDSAATHVTRLTGDNDGSIVGPAMKPESDTMPSSSSRRGRPQGHGRPDRIAPPASFMRRRTHGCN